MPTFKPVPTRESRLDSFIGYGGTCKAMADGIQCKCLKKMNRSFSQASVCQEWYSLFTLLTVRNSAAVVHAPLGCVSAGTCMNIFNRLGQSVRGENPIKSARWFASNLNESDTIHGGEFKLRQTVKEVDRRYQPEAIFIFTSCVSGIIGDPVADIVRELQEEVRARLVLSQCEGFRSAVWATGFDSAFHGIIQYLLEKREEKFSDLVNVITPLTVGRLDEIEIERLFTELKLRANFIPCYSSIEGLRQTVQAAATTSTCLTYGDYFARGLTDLYGVPHTREVMPLGLENTDRWLRKLAEIVGKEKETEKLIAREHRRVGGQLKALRKLLKGKRVYVSAGQARAVTMSAMAEELGFELIGTTVYHYDDVIAESIRRLAERSGLTTFNVANLQPYEQANLLARLKPDLYLSDEITTIWVAKQGFPTMMIYDYGMNYLGYNGLVKIGEKMVTAMTNTGVNRKIARYSPLPYRASWYEQDPFKYLAPQGGNE
jgi:nitrogenase molybdenum-iron protein alpha chain